MNSCQSPAQPARSRWGQSVGISQALSRKDQSVMSWSVFSRSSLQRNQPVRRRSVCTTTPVTSSGVNGPGWPSMRANWKPWVVWRGSKTSPGVPAATTWSIMPTCEGAPGNSMVGLRWSCVTSPDGSRNSPWTRVSSVPSGPRSLKRSQPLMFCPRSTTWRSGWGRVTETGRSSWVRRVGGAGEKERLPRSYVGDRDGVPRVRFGPVVLALPRHEVGAADRSGGRLPVGAGGDDGVPGVELAEEAEGGAVAVAGLEEPGAAAPPAVGEHDLPVVVAGDEQVGDVVGLHVQRGRVAGEAGGQLDVADAAAVEEGLVDPVRGGVEAGVGGRRMEPEGVTQHVGRALGLVRLDEAGGPVRRMEEAGLAPGRRRPGALAGFGPDLDAPGGALA